MPRHHQPTLEREPPIERAQAVPQAGAQTRPRKLIVVIPAYNEEDRVGEVIHQLRQALSGLEAKQITTQLFVVNDGSKDRTKALAIEAGADRVISHKTNRGLGAAVRSGLTAATADGADIAVKFDADLQHNPTDVLAMIEPILNDEADVVYGFRFANLQYRMPVVRRVGNKVFTTLMRWLTDWDVRDAQPGIFALDRSYLTDFRMPGDYNYTQQIILDAYHKGMRFAHVPVSFKKRETGRSFVTFRYPFRVFWQILMVLVGVKPMRVFGTLGLICILIASTILVYQLTLFLLGESTRPVQNVNLVLGLGLFGVQTFFYGILAQLIIERR
jgi:glycosyltransferase involved in cell wall biosynthesis